MVSIDYVLMKTDLLCYDFAGHFPDYHSSFSKLFCIFFSYICIDWLHVFSLPTVPFQSFGKVDNFP